MSRRRRRERGSGSSPPEMRNGGPSPRTAAETVAATARKKLSLDQDTATEAQRGRRVTAEAYPPAGRGGMWLPCLEYGRDHPDSDAWCDADGHVYHAGNPPMLRLRRMMDRALRRPT